MQKKFLLIVIACFILNCCTTQVTLDTMSVEVNKKTHYWGSILDIDSTFTVTVTDINGKERPISQGNNGYAIFGISTVILDTEGEIPLTFQYVVNADDSGRYYYNIGKILYASESINVVKPDASEIKSLNLIGVESGSLIEPQNIKDLYNVKFLSNLEVTLTNNEQYYVLNSSASWNTIIKDSDLNIIPIDESTDLAVGDYYLYSLYCGKYSDNGILLRIRQ